MDRGSGLTYDFLHTLSRRLSGDARWKDTEYVVNICSGDINIDPLIYVYLDMHHRKSTDKINIVDLVLSRMRESLKFTTNDFVDGTYVYRFSGNKSRRRWTNKIIDDLNR